MTQLVKRSGNLILGRMQSTRWSQTIISYHVRKHHALFTDHILFELILAKFGIPRAYDRVVNVNKTESTHTINEGNHKPTHFDWKLSFQESDFHSTLFYKCSQSKE